MPKTNDYDAIVVGSGITGGWAAKELTEKGLRVLLIERGRNVRHRIDYVTEHVPSWELPYRGEGDRKRLQEEQPIQSQNSVADETTRHFFVNDRDHPYLQDKDNPFLWMRGYQLGGRSLTWYRQCYRLSDLDFEANAREGVGVDWPVRYADIAPWYDYVEEFIGISGQAEGLAQLPDGNFLPPMEMNCVEHALKESIERRHSDRRLTIGRTATLTKPKNGRAACHYCGPCIRGCSTGSYFSTQSTTLPAAMATERLTVHTDAIVHSVVYDDTTDRATGVRVIDAKTKRTTEYSAKLVFLCASTLGTAQILLNSKTPRFPNGLANSSGTLGHYLMDHVCGPVILGGMPGFEDRYYSGNRPNCIYLPRFENVTRPHPNFLRGYGFQGGAEREGWRRGTSQPGFGADFKHALRQPGPWRMILVGYGECLPRYDNYVELDGERIDQWGIPLLRVHFTWGENERQMMKSVATEGASMLEDAGVQNTITIPSLTPGSAIHEMGTARMGRDPETSVVNGFNQCHDVPNLFITDGSFMTSSACQNPSFTYMAFTARACHYAVEQLKQGKL